MCGSSKISAETITTKGRRVITTITLKVTLEELYSGNRRYLQIKDGIRCLSCKYTTMIQGPTARLNCRRCLGSGRQTTKRLIMVNIRKGMIHGDKLIFAGAAIAQTGFGKPGRIIVKLDEQEHPVFKRRGNDIYINRQIPMNKENRYTIETIDGRTLSITYNGDNARQDIILGEGIPVYGRKQTGALIVQYA